MKQANIFLLVFVGGILWGATSKKECSVSDFANIAYSTHDPKERHERIIGWLDESGPVCTKEQLVKIYINLAQAVGTADTISVRTKIEKLYERAK
jgi:hypothetical protein